MPTILAPLLGYLIPVGAWIAAKTLTPQLIANLAVHLGEHWAKKTETPDDDKCVADVAKAWGVEL